MTDTYKSELAFVNRFTRALPADKIAENYCRQVHGAAYSRAIPARVNNPQILTLNESLAIELGLAALLDDRQALAQVLGGNSLLAGMDPYAMAYGGHQFGNWAGQLGDGRAINLGELTDLQNKHWTLQLKGAGPTPYSRHADGRAVLRSSLREYLCSEAMFNLGVPTTRALSLVTTGDRVVRDMFYDGNPQAELGAIVCRVSPSFIRFGNFELPASRGDNDLLRNLLNFVIEADWEDLAIKLKSSVSDKATTDVYLEWFQRVCRLTQTMVVQWMRVGFVHGVMNTDNMSTLGLTIDYGPYGWVDDYNPDWTPNTTDAANRRYRFGNQAAIARWNLYQLANAIYPVVQDAETLQQILNNLPSEYEMEFADMMRLKLGFTHTSSCPVSLIDDLKKLLCLHATDMTLFFRLLSGFVPEDSDCHLPELLRPAFYDIHEMSLETMRSYQDWETRYRDGLLQDSCDQQQRKLLMNSINPAFVPRNYLAQQAIDAAEAGDMSIFSFLLNTLEKPYQDPSAANAHLAAKRPQWAANKAGCSMLSCSS
ncbi:MAG: YdiU family protein [Pseudohongiella sp.]|nr:YdiU family protein [Pseudohongiella sp.]